MTGTPDNAIILGYTHRQPAHIKAVVRQLAAAIEEHQLSR